MSGAIYRPMAQLQSVLDVLFPPQCPCCRAPIAAGQGLCGPCWTGFPFIHGNACRACGLPLPGAEDGDAFCDSCLHLPPPWNRGVAVALYEGRARQVALGIKHGDRGDLVPLAAGWLARNARAFLRDGPVVIPVPLHRRRFLRRRSNQSAEIARELCRATGAAYLPDGLVRTRATPSQSGRDRAARFANLDGAMAANPAQAAKIAGQRVLLIDDVMTTGATLSACTHALQAAGAAEVNVAVLARVDQAH